MPNCASAALDAGLYTIMSLLAGRLGAEEIAAHNALLCILELVKAIKLHTMYKMSKF